MLFRSLILLLCEKLTDPEAGMPLSKGTVEHVEGTAALDFGFAGDHVGKSQRYPNSVEHMLEHIQCAGVVLSVGEDYDRLHRTVLNCDHFGQVVEGELVLNNSEDALLVLCREAALRRSASDPNENGAARRLVLPLANGVQLVLATNWGCQGFERDLNVEAANVAYFRHLGPFG